MTCVDTASVEPGNEFEIYGSVSVAVPSGRVYLPQGANQYLWNRRAGTGEHGRVSIAEGNSIEPGTTKRFYVRNGDVSSVAIKAATSLLEHDDSTSNDTFNTGGVNFDLDQLTRGADGRMTALAVGEIATRSVNLEAGDSTIFGSGVERLKLEFSLTRLR